MLRKSLPIFNHFGPHIAGVIPPAEGLTIANMTAGQIFGNYVRHIGIGAIFAAGVIGIVKSSPIIIQAFTKGFKEIFAAPFKDWSVFWLLAPILVLWIVLEIYFDTHKKETLGWNTALGNGISMFWITANLMRYLFSENMANFSWTKFITIMLVLVYAVFVSTIAFIP